MNEVKIEGESSPPHSPSALGPTMMKKLLISGVKSLVAFAGVLLLLTLITLNAALSRYHVIVKKSSRSYNVSQPSKVPIDLTQFEVNNFGPNDNVLVKKDRQKNKTRLKTILMWNDAYGMRQYDIGWGREPYFKFKCPETRCIGTADRKFLPRVEDFDAIMIHQRGIVWSDMPATRSPRQYWIHWNMESASYRSVDIRRLNGLFNWTVTYKRTSDFYRPYGRVHKVKNHSTGNELATHIQKFGERNRHLANGDGAGATFNRNNSTLKAAWFVSNCWSMSNRESFVKEMKKYMTVDIYGGCGSFKCPRTNEASCYRQMEKNYKFYLSFENSICDDYITEKYFNVMSYHVIPITLGGTNMSAISPPHSSIDSLRFKSVKHLVDHLRMLNEDDAAYASYFWWKEFYEVRNSEADRVQPYCDLCKRLNNPKEPPKVYQDMYHWWVTDSHCRRWG